MLDDLENVTKDAESLSVIALSVSQIERILDGSHEIPDHLNTVDERGRLQCSFRIVPEGNTSPKRGISSLPSKAQA